MTTHVLSINNIIIIIIIIIAIIGKEQSDCPLPIVAIMMMMMMMLLLMESTCVVKRTSGPVRQTSELISSSGTATSEFSASGSSHSSISEDLDTRDQLAPIWRFLKWGRIDIGESESQI